MTGLILIVDDETSVRSHLRELLENTGYTVAEAETGEVALSLYSQLHPDLLLLDAMMPEMDGFACCQRLKQLPNGDQTPVLIMTDNYDQDAIEQVFAVGATDYVHKPIQWSVLGRRVQRMLTARRTMEELRSLRDESRSHSSQAQLRETQLRVALQATGMGIWDWDIRTDSLTWSQNQQLLFGFNPGEFDGKYQTFLKRIHYDSRHIINNAVQSAINGNTEYDLEFRILLPDGGMRWIASKGVVIRDSQIAVRMTGVDMDITKRKQNESALEVYANHQGLIGELSQMALAGSDLSTLFEWAVFFLAKSLGVEYSKILELLPDGENFLLRAGVGWEKGLVGKALVAADVNSQAGYTLISNEPVVTDLRTESRFYQPQLLCEHRVISGVSVLIHGKKGSFGVLGAHTQLRRSFTQEDVYFLQAIANILGTAIERKLTEEALRQSEERFQILARATNDTVWDWDLLTDQMWWNESLNTQFGYLLEDVTQTSPGNGETTSDFIQTTRNWWSDRIHPEERQIVLSDLQRVIDGEEQFWSIEYRFRTNSDEYAYVFDRGFVVRNQEGQAVRMIGAMMDITERKHAQEELVRQNMRSHLFADVTLKIRQSLQVDEILQTSVNEVQELLDADRVLIMRLYPDWSVKVVKEAILPGCPSLQGQDIIDPCFHETYLEKYRQGGISAVANIEEADIQSCYVEFLQQFGVKANLVVPILLQNQLWGLLITHQCTHPRSWTNWETELLCQLADQIGIALAQGKLLERETRQRQELARSNEELQQFAFVASHDLQEPLRKIKSFGDRLKATCGDQIGEQGLDYIERMANASRRMQSLIEDLLMLSRITTRAQPFVPVNLVQITAEVLSDLEVSLQQTEGQVEIHNLPIINADPIQMRQLLQNLIGNALKFHHPQTPPLVKIYSQFIPKPNGGEDCQIIIEDNGIGFDEKYLDRIFNVFQRLHGRSEYEGTGIGLAICRKIVERHQGKITAQSHPGQGSKFIVTLPVSITS